MTFADAFKNKYLEQFGTNETMDIIMSLLIAILAGAYIYYFYKKVYKGVMFSKMFAVALVGMTVITTFIILGVTSNIVLSLGMVGALSIVRFRSSIKEPVDIVYIFWAISEGIIIGSQQYILALFGTIIISIAIAVFSTHKERLSRYMLVVRYKDEEEKEIMKEIKQNSKRHEIKSNTLYQGNEQELIVEVLMNSKENKLIENLKKYNNITMASLVKYNGEYIIE